MRKLIHFKLWEWLPYDVKLSVGKYYSTLFNFIDLALDSHWVTGVQLAPYSQPFATNS